MLELGCGNGIISIMLALQRPNWQITGIDIQPTLINLARQNAIISETAVTFTVADIREYMADAPCDIIIANPPFRRHGTGRPNPDQSLQISRDDALCTPDDVCRCLHRNLDDDGNALLIYPHGRESHLREACGKYLLDINAVFPTAGTNKYLIFRIKHRGHKP